MSLASKIANLFSPLQAPLAPNDESLSRSQFATTPTHEIVQLRSRDVQPKRRLSMEEEEEVRHPYIHVSRSLGDPGNLVDKSFSVCWLVELEAHPVICSCTRSIQ